MAKKKKAAKRERRGPVTIRVPVTVWVPVPVFQGTARFSDLDEWARQLGFAIDLRPREGPPLSVLPHDSGKK